MSTTSDRVKRIRRDQETGEFYCCGKYFDSYEDAVHWLDYVIDVECDIADMKRKERLENGYFD